MMGRSENRNVKHSKEDKGTETIKLIIEKRAGGVRHLSLDGDS